MMKISSMMKAPVKDHTLEVPTFEGDIANVQEVSADSETIRVLSPSPAMTKEQALIHAAHIVALADKSENFHEFRQILKAVLET
jgi:hypothetical protein